MIKHANINFIQSTNNYPNIAISFGRTLHYAYRLKRNCVSNFDSEGGVIGHSIISDAHQNPVEYI